MSSKSEVLNSSSVILTFNKNKIVSITMLVPYVTRACLKLLHISIA